MYRGKKAADRISMGPLWDFDWGFGYTGEGNVYFEKSQYRVSLHPFFRRFFDDPEFKALYKETWNTFYDSGLLITILETFVDTEATKLEESQKANFSVWKWKNKPVYETEIAKLKGFIRDRLMYLDVEIKAM
jgi:hypothetical protein